MIATEPLPAEAWDQIGLRRRETFADLRHLRIYGQRTADDRFAFGGRGAPYHFASRDKPSFDRDRRVHSAPARGARGPVPRGRRLRGHARVGRRRSASRATGTRSVGLDRGRGLAWAGGYVGDGVATTNLAGRTLGAADHLAGERAHAAAVGGPSLAPWEPEPLRWLGVNGGRLLMSSADRSESRTGKPAKRARAFARFIGY